MAYSLNTPSLTDSSSYDGFYADAFCACAWPFYDAYAFFHKAWEPLKTSEQLFIYDRVTFVQTAILLFLLSRVYRPSQYRASSTLLLLMHCRLDNK